MTDVLRAQLARGAEVVAPELLGWRLERQTPDGVIAVRLVEVEAYSGSLDPASHAFRGMTQRTRAMFGRAGLLYVYRSYGAHWACNIVTGVEGTADAVLVRAGQVVEGAGLARANRPGVTDRNLARGPGNLARALGITGEDYGVDLLDPASSVRLVPGPPSGTVVAGPRVGVSKAADVPWRFHLAGEESVSAYRRSPRAPVLEDGRS